MIDDPERPAGGQLDVSRKAKPPLPPLLAALVIIALAIPIYAVVVIWFGWAMGLIVIGICFSLILVRFSIAAERRRNEGL